MWNESARMIQTHVLRALWRLGGSRPSIRTSGHIGALLFILSGSFAWAQAPSDPLITPDNALPDLSRNNIMIPGDRHTWDGLLASFDRLFLEGEGRISIVQIGGSHVQADAWTARSRDRFQRVAPGIRAGRGFIFPYNMAGSNNPYWYLPEYTGHWTAVKNTQRPDSTTDLGLAGYTVSTRDPDTRLRISFRGQYEGHPFTRATVLHGTDSSYHVSALCNDPAVTVLWSTDVARGETVFEFSKPMDTLDLRFEQTDTLSQRSFTLRGIILGSDDPGVYYHALGVNGASTRSWLACPAFGEDLARVAPDLVVFSIGINDAHDPAFSTERFERNYDELIAQVRNVAPEAAILLVTNSDSFRKRRYLVRNGDDVRNAMLRLATRHGCAVWDLFGVMGGPGSIKRWRRHGLAKADLIHFTREGYELIGDLMFTAIMKSYGEHAARAAHGSSR